MKEGEVMNTRSMLIRQTLLALAVTLLAAAACMGLSLQTAYADETATTLPEPIDGVITLTQNVNLAETAVINADTTLDLAGYTITGPTSNYPTTLSVSAGTLTIKDSSESHTGTITVSGDYGTAITGSVVIESGAIEATGKMAYAVNSLNNGPVKINGGSISVSGAEAIAVNLPRGSSAEMNGGSIVAEYTGSEGINGVYVAGASAAFTLNDGEINVNGSSSKAIQLFGSNAKATVKGGKIIVNGNGSIGVCSSPFLPTQIDVIGGSLSVSGSRANAVFADEDAILNISGGTLRSANAAAVSAYKNTKITMTDGEIISENAAGIAVSSTGNAVNISGGAITGGTYGVQISNADANTVSVSEEAMNQLSGNNGKVSANLIKDPTTGSYTAIAGAYVLMNIPYADFYDAELGEGAAAVDAVTSATKMKPRTGGLAGGSYHVDPEGTDISGVIYPVFVKDMSALEGLKEVTDADKLSITVTNRGQESTSEYLGSDALFESANYSYYKLTEKPARSKALTVGADGKFSFSAVSGRAATVEGVTGDIEYESHHNNDVEITLSGTTGIENGQAVSGVIVTADDGSKEALRHIAEIWRGVCIGWNDATKWYGKTITNIRYITQSSVIDYPVEIKIKSNPGQVTAAFTDLKNIALTGLPEDIRNPKATVQSVVGRGETPTVIAEMIDVTDGVITITDAAAVSTNYAIRVTSDNYADIILQATSPEDSGEGTSGGGSTPSEAAQAKAALNTAITDAKAIAADGYTAESYKALTDAVAAAEKVAADPNATADQLKAAAEAVAAAKAGLVQAADDSEYTVTAEAVDTAAGTAALTNPRDAAKYNIPKTVVLTDGKTYKVTAIGAGAFTGKQTKKVVVGANVDTIEQGAFDQSGVTKLIVKTKKLKKASVAGSLTGSSVKVVKVKVGKKKVNKKFVKKYRKIFTAQNAGKKVKVK